MGVDELMSKRIVTVHMDDTLKVVKEIFDNSRFHHLLVVESDVLVGVITDRDLLKAISPNLGTAAETTRDTETLSKKAHQIMLRKPMTLRAKAKIYHAIEIFNNHNVSCIPVIDNDHKPVGIISWRDIMKTLKSTP